MDCEPLESQPHSAIASHRLQVQMNDSSEPHSVVSVLMFPIACGRMPTIEALLRVLVFDSTFVNQKPEIVHLNA
jgi:hypothetical protein